MYECMYVHLDKYRCTRVCVCIYPCLYLYICILNIPIYFFIYIYLSLYLCTPIYIHTQILKYTYMCVCKGSREVTPPDLRIVESWIPVRIMTLEFFSVPRNFIIPRLHPQRRQTNVLTPLLSCSTRNWWENEVFTFLTILLSVKSLLVSLVELV